MTSLEMSNAFEVYYNNIMSNQSPGIDEYEKSVLLSRAELELVKNSFNSKGNKYQEGYDDSAKRQYDFSVLNTLKKYIEDTRNDINFTPVWTNKESVITHDKNNIFDENYMDNLFMRYTFKTPSDFLFFLNEEAYVEKIVGLPDMHLRNAAIVTPINYEEYTVSRGGTYKYPLTKNECWRLIINGDLTQNREVEIIAPYNHKIVSYTMRYVRKPKPIILTNIQEEYGTTIDGYGEIMECELPEAMHEEIVQRAVEIAKGIYRTGETETLVNLGQRAE